MTLKFEDRPWPLDDLVADSATAEWFLINVHLTGNILEMSNHRYATYAYKGCEITLVKTFAKEKQKKSPLILSKIQNEFS